MARFPWFFMDEGKRRSEDVRWALESFNCGIKKSFEDKFKQFHVHLYNNVVRTRGVCCIRCSKSKPVEDWCSLCREWRNAILANHIYKNTAKVNWKNIDSSKWPSDIKEVQKVYLPSWYKGKLDDTDLSSCLSIMVNCTLFKNHQNLQDIREIRNKVSHGGSSMSELEKQQDVDTILKYMETDELKNWPSVQREISHLQILKNYSLKDIYEQNLMDELERNRIEERLYGKTCLLGYFHSYLKKCLILMAMTVALMAVMIYAWNQSNDLEGDPWIPGRPSFFFTFHDEFVGREWLKQNIRDNLNKTRDGVILVAEPGFGKSALIANFVKNYDDNGNLPLLGYHICQYDSRSSLDVSNFIINLWRDLRKRYHEFDNKTPARFKEYKEIKRYCTLDPSQCFQELIGNPLNSANLSKRSLLVVDAIDECQNSPLEIETITIPALLLKQYKLLQPVVSIFMTSRNNSELLSLFRSFKKIQIEQNSDENKDDLKSLIRRKTRCTDLYVDRLVEETGHNFLILRYYLSNIHETCRMNQMQNIKSIYEMHDRIFLRIYGDGFSRKYPFDRSFFEVLCSQRITESITVHLMKNILKYYTPGPDDDEFEEMIHRVTTNIIRTSDKHEIIVPHSSLFDWLVSEENVKFRVNVQRGHYAWTYYLHSKLRMITKQSPLIVYHSWIDQSYSLARHIIETGNDSLQDEFISGKLKIADFRILCRSCWKYDIPFSNIDNGKVSHIGHAASFVDDYNFIKTLTLLSRTTDWTIEAFIAYYKHTTKVIDPHLQVFFKQTQLT